MRFRSLVAAIGLATIIGSGAAQAVPILTFGDTGTSPAPFVLNRTGSTSSISVVGDDIQVTQIDAGLGTPFTAFLNLSAASTGAAVVSGTNVVQNFSGSYSITSNANGTGTNFLSGTFIDSVSGKVGGFGLTLSASTPPSGAVTMTSGVISPADLAFNRALSLAVTDLLVSVQVINGTLASNAGIIAGNFSSQQNVPVVEPASIFMLLTGTAALLGYRAKRRRLDGRRAA
jgi:hypothetical protein